jgi:hypothetical protein
MIPHPPAAVIFRRCPVAAGGRLALHDFPLFE